MKSGQKVLWSGVDTVAFLVRRLASTVFALEDLQQFSIVVTRDKAKIAKVADWIGTMPWIKDAPVLLLFCGDMRRGQQACARHGRAHANNNMDTFLNTAVDAAITQAISGGLE